MPTHIGMGGKSKFIQAMVAIPTNLHDSQHLSDFLLGEETRVQGNPVYQGQRKVMCTHTLKA